MKHCGKLVIAGMFFAAVVMGGYAWWNAYRSSSRAREFWGRDAALAIIRSPRVDLLLLEPGPEIVDPGELPMSGELIRVGGLHYYVTRTVDISRRPGLLHPLTVLTEDASYDWSASATRCEPQWEFGLRMSGSADQATVTVLFDTDCNRIWWVERERGLTLVKDRTKGYRKKRQEWVDVPGVPGISKFPNVAETK